MTFLDAYRIATEAIIKKYAFINASFAQMQGKQREEIILSAGHTSLQIIQIVGHLAEYRMERRIHEESEILQVQTLGQGSNERAKTLVVSTESVLSIWNYSNF